MVHFSRAGVRYARRFYDTAHGGFVEGRTSVNEYWSAVEDAGVSEGSFAKYMFGRTMKALGNFGYNTADAVVGAYEQPGDVGAGLTKAVVNFGPEGFNGAVNTLKTAANGYTLIAEKLGAGDGAFETFRESKPYNITPLLEYENKTQSGTALVANLLVGAAATKYGNYSVELNTGTPGTLSANPIPIRLVAPAEAGADAARLGRIAISDFDEFKKISSGELKPRTVYEFGGAEFETDALGRSVSTRGYVDTSKTGHRLPSVDRAIADLPGSTEFDVGFH